MDVTSAARLELDVGNTRIKWRVISGSQFIAQGSDLKQELVTDKALPVWFSSVNCVWVSSVHQQQNKWIEQYFPFAEYAEVKAKQHGLKNSYDNVARMGVDRWLAMLAARHGKSDQAHIVIDAGTAITLDIIDELGQHMGGYICPGLNMMKSTLLGGTNKVLAEAGWSVGRAPGKHTQHCVDHGIQDMVASWLERHFQMLPEACITISGGDGENLAALLKKKSRYVPDLVLDGLNISLNNK